MTRQQSSRSNKRARARFDDIFIIILISDTCHTCHPPHTYVYIVSIITIYVLLVYLLLFVCRALITPAFHHIQNVIYMKKTYCLEIMFCYDMTPNIIFPWYGKVLPNIYVSMRGYMMRRRMRLMINIIKASTLYASCV